MALGLTQPLVKMSTRNIPGGKCSRCVRLTISPTSRAGCHEIWEPKPPGTGPVTRIIYLFRCPSFTNLFRRETLHVSESSSVRHQEFIHCTLRNVVCHYRFVGSFRAGPGMCSNVPLFGVF